MQLYLKIKSVYIGVSVIIRDEVGDFLVGFSVHSPLLFDAQIAKAFFQIHLEGDCLVVIQSMIVIILSYHILKLIIEVKQLLDFYSVRKASFVCRECNSIAL